MARTEPRSDRHQVEARVGPLTETQWSTLLERTWTPAHEDSPALRVKDLVDEARTLYGSAPSAGRVDEVTDDPRWTALAQIFADHAERHSQVTAWRERHIPSGLLRPEEVEDFVSARLQEDLFGASAGRTSRPLVLRWRALDGEPGASLRTETGCLAELANAADGLLSCTTWRSDEAVYFVLTGIAPPAYRIRAEIMIGKSLAVTTVQLNVDPRTPREAVADMYEHVRRHHMHLMDTELPRRLKPLDEKKAALMVFLFSRPATTWEQHRKAWNDAHPEWEYTGVRDFRRDAIRGRDAVIGPLVPETKPRVPTM